MNYKHPFRNLIPTWLASSLLIAGYAFLATRLHGTPNWLDTLLFVAWVALSSRWLDLLAARLEHRRIIRWLATAIPLLALLAIALPWALHLPVGDGLWRWNQETGHPSLYLEYLSLTSLLLTIPQTVYVIQGLLFMGNTKQDIVTLSSPLWVAGLALSAGLGLTLLALAWRITWCGLLNVPAIATPWTHLHNRSRLVWTNLRRSRAWPWLWQGLIVLLADRDPLNQYFVNNPDDFFEMEPEEVYVDPDNKYIVLDQLWCATNDWEIDLETDCRFFGDSMPEYLNMLDKEGKVQRESARDVWVLRDRSGYPAAEVPIRAVGFSFDVVDGKGDLVAREDASRATRYLHKYARYSVQDDIYEVSEFDLDLRRKKGSARVRKLSRPVDYLTSSISRSDSSIIKSRLKRNAFGTHLHFGDIEFRSQVWAYYKIPLGGRGDRQAKTQFQPLGPAAPPERVFETTSVWLPLEPRFAKQYGETNFEAALRSMGRALAMAVTIQEFCDPADVGNVEMAEHPDTGLPTIFLHDTVPGGIGIAEQTYYDFENVFRRAYRILKECLNAVTDPNHLGCPLCVTEGWGDETMVNRPVAIEIMQAMLGDDPVVERKSDEEIVSILSRRGFHDLEYVKVGGMGRIYRGRLEGRDLAIKVINPVTLGLSSEAQERMAREASIWNKLIHPNIVRLREVNQPEGLFYLTMDWMPRGSLRDRLPVGGMEPKEAQRIALGVARALAHLAEGSYVHRDVNPNNILFDNADQPRLTDFGIAKSIGDDMGVQTQAGIAMGTYGYQPPEQLRDAASCDEWADVFALGVVLFEMLTGELPSRNTIGAVPDDVLTKVQNTPFADLLRDMLAAEPSQRPSAAQVVEALEGA
jgi:hypothetical protein